ncbi:MAG TPA: hypothetical protein VKQ70_00555 [Caulobacteraceae bacterium]|jgi:hypothetical protein|nr:hypothetical protein [Caulobacteraceae bacterium]
MRLVTATLAIAAAVASATVAVAAPARLSDVQFLAANRCLGIESTKAFATPDTDTLRKLVKDQNWGRDSYIYDKADQAREDGQREASRSGAENSIRLASERDGVCRALVSTTTASTPSGAHNMMQ